ncbi:MAG: hypothetical protein D6815_07020, partial [Candidatus Dadabacteria bacterium]
DILPDLHDFVGDMEASLAELLAAAGPRAHEQPAARVQPASGAASRAGAEALDSQEAAEAGDSHSAAEPVQPQTSENA